MWFLAAAVFKNYSKHTDWRVHKINHVLYNPVAQATFIMSVIILWALDLPSLQAGRVVTVFHSSLSARLPLCGKQEFGKGALMWVWMCQHSWLEEFRESFMACLSFSFNYPILTILEDIGRWVLLACSMVNRLSTDTPGLSMICRRSASAAREFPFFLDSCVPIWLQKCLLKQKNSASQCLAEESPPWHKTQQSDTWKLLIMVGGGISDQVEVISKWWIQRSRY